MKQFMSRVKNLSQKAAEIKAAIQQVPPKVAEIREAVAATTGQLQQLKSEIHYSVADLKADQEDSLSEAMQEINSSVDVFAKAGFVLNGVDLEISPVQRMLVHLARVEDAHASVIRSLLSANQHRRTTRAILSALLQAKQMAETVEFNSLVYDEVAVGIGPIPSIRLCWRPEEIEAVEMVQPQPAFPQPPPLAASAPAPQSVFGSSPFFEKREPRPVPVTTTISEVPTGAGWGSQKASTEKPVVSPGSEVSTDPLARFKKMPDLFRPKG
jgi:hypothetical protein